MRKFVIGKIEIVIILFGIFVLAKPLCVQAKGESVSFGSESYTSSENETFPVGVYVQAEEKMERYHVEIRYDNKRLKYISGADNENDGLITLEGTGMENQVKYMIYFQAISGGNTGIYVKSAIIEDEENADGITLDSSSLSKADITISGNDTVGTSFWDEDSEEKTNVEGIPILDSIISEGNENYYIVDLSQYIPDLINWNYKTEKKEYNGSQITFLTDYENNVHIFCLMNQKQNISLYAYNSSDGTIYPVYWYQTENEEKYIYTSIYAINDRPEGLTEEHVDNLNVIYAIDTLGHGEFCYLNENNEMISIESDNDKQITDETAKEIINDKIIIICIIGGVSFGTLIIFWGYCHHKKKRKKQLHNARKRAMQTVEDIDDIPDSGLNQTVISVQDVTMTFKVSTSNASGIKEYLIQMLKHQVTYRKMNALNHVSFDIYKGEVVGIIGTNGSGKSTILKIVSGALKPTGGKVIVDKNKVQLLTLGTGFDMELSARENVYLNGAIIGYSRKFIDEHYHEIVEFSELEGFMEEKVKNFSSGMVSRLGFAIATIGEAAEILILDEVLSVGDEFFRKKSLERVKEMIHGGSTVLLVSHSMSTILDNCTKVVWIEKGDLRMIGDAKTVCSEYQKQNEK